MLTQSQIKRTLSHPDAVKYVAGLLKINQFTSRRLVKAAEAKADEPWRVFCGVAEGDWAAVKGYYRLIDAPDESAVTSASILRPHRFCVYSLRGQLTAD